jgi:hypothetical protein
VSRRLAAWRHAQSAASLFPGLRAVEALTTSLPLFLLLFASTYLVTATEYGIARNVDEACPASWLI